MARVFFDNYDSILADGRDQHWRDVNLAADLAVANADWPRLAAAQGWLDDRKASADASLDAFRASAKTAPRPTAVRNPRIPTGSTTA